MSSTTSDHKVSICICGINELDEIQYFSIELNDLVKRRPTKDLRRMEAKNIQPDILTADHTSKVVAVDGVVYVIRVGAFEETSPYGNTQPYIQCLDTRGENRWIQMRIEHNPNEVEVANLDGKIYIFGCHDKNQTSSEVFDPVKETFEMVPSGYRHDMKLVGVDRNLKKIVFLIKIVYGFCTGFGAGPFAFYNTEDMTWTREEHPQLDSYLKKSLLQSSDRGLSVVAGTRIYWLSDMKDMKAYDFSERQFYYSAMLTDMPGSFDTADFGYIASAVLLHMNEDYFCLVWKYEELFGDHIFVRILRVSSCTTTKMLTVSVLGTDKYLISADYFDLKVALRLTDTPLMLKTDDTDQGFEDSVMLEESVESPPLEDLTISHVFGGDKFISDVPLSIWLYGDCKGDKLFCFPIKVSDSEILREVKRRRICYDSWSHGVGGEKEMEIVDSVLVDNCGILGSAHVAVDNMIYNIGGTYEDPWLTESDVYPRPEPYIQCFDTSTMEIVTDKRYKMCTGRKYAQVAYLDGKIYIFGGDQTPYSSVVESSEVFDTVTGISKWMPDGYETHYTLLGVDCVYKRIVFIPNWSYYTGQLVERDYYPIIFYNTVSNTWTTQNETKLYVDMFKTNYDGNYVIVGTTIYMFSAARFMSYDFEKHEPRASNIVEGIPIDWECYPAFLFHMYDNLFCIVIMDCDVRRSEYQRVFFVVSRISSSKTFDYLLNVDVLHIDAYIVPDDPNFNLRGALKVSTNSHKTDTEEGPKDAASSLALYSRPDS